MRRMGVLAGVPSHTSRWYNRQLSADGLPTFCPSLSMTSIPVVADKRYDSALLFLRLIAGTIFIAHGWQKVFVFHFAGVTQAFTHMGIPMAGLVAPAVALVELIGGIALVLGLLTRAAALLIAVDMLCAILLVHAKNGFFLPRGIEFVLANFGLVIAIALLGAGAYSIDATLGRGGSTRL